jgi:DOPA 4,5-dioxygenase
MSDSLAGIHSYHAHIYYDPATREVAAALREELERLFPSAQLGRWHDRPVGPHPRASYQVEFAPELFARIVPYLMLHRRELVVFLHPETGRPRDDHQHHALWLGAMLPLDLTILPETDTAVA